MTAPDAHTSKHTEPLGAGWTTVTVVIGILAALIAVAGMTLSFHAVSVRMTPSFGPRWAWLVPLVVDLTVLVFSGVDLVLTRRGIPHPLARLTVYGATFGTVWLNYAAGGDLTGRVAHVLMPSVWVMFVELMRHVVRHEANLVGANLREPIPGARWFLAPWPTLKLWRRMILWRQHDYTAALARERVRLNRIAAMRDEHGRAWRWRVSAATRLSINLGESATPVTPPAACDGDTPPAETPTDTSDTPRADTPTRGARRSSDTPATPRRRPATRPTVTPLTAGGATPLPHADLQADLKVLDAAGPPAWHEMTQADAVRRLDELLPGRVASHAVALLAARGVTVDKVYVRVTRSRARKSDTPAVSGRSDTDDTPQERAS